MKKSTKIAMAFLALAGATGSAAVAQDMKGKRGDGMRGMRLERLDADSSGDVTFEEFSAAANSRITDADANNDGRMTVEEIADEILRRRAERQAKRLIERFDTDDDGVLTTEEVQSRQQKRFALLDRNDDGKIEADEMPRRGRRGDRR